MTGDQIDAIADAFTDLFGLLRDADPSDRADGDLVRSLTLAARLADQRMGGRTGH